LTLVDANVAAQSTIRCGNAFFACYGYITFILEYGFKAQLFYCASRQIIKLSASC